MFGLTCGTMGFSEFRGIGSGLLSGFFKVSDILSVLKNLKAPQFRCDFMNDIVPCIQSPVRGLVFSRKAGLNELVVQKIRSFVIRMVVRLEGLQLFEDVLVQQLLMKSGDTGVHIFGSLDFSFRP